MTGIPSITQETSNPVSRLMSSYPATSLHDDALALIMELSGKLQTTLEVDGLIELFAQFIASHFECNTLNYCSVDKTIELKFGDSTGKNKLQYDMKLLDSELGEIMISRDKRFAKNEISQIENLLATLFYPLRNALLYRAAIQSAFIDSLTGAKNRTAFDSNFSREIEFNRRKQTGLSLLVLDIDLFKRINDQYGHLIGDMVLKEVASTVEQTIRSSDALYRYGGEEFVVVLNDTSRAGANLLAQRIRQNIENLRIKSLNDVRITLSLGVSTMDKRDTPQSLFERADAALYQAKENGRNQVVTG